MGMSETIQRLATLIESVQPDALRMRLEGELRQLTTDMEAITPPKVRPELELVHGVMFENGDPKGPAFCPVCYEERGKRFALQKQAGAAIGIISLSGGTSKSMPVGRGRLYCPKCKTHFPLPPGK